MSLPHPFPYQGSKRKIAPHILPYVPSDLATFIEPFAGSAAMSIALAHQGNAAQIWLNDINAALMHLWRRILETPETLAKQYSDLWHAQTGNEKTFYFETRARFNQSHDPELLLYLLARCVKAAVRYNAKGEFNQSPDNRRAGMHPTTMRQNILSTAGLLAARTTVTSLDYRDVLAAATSADVVYLDPPYQGVAGRDPRYCETLPFEEFVSSLAVLNARDIAYLVSYDGKNGDKQYGHDLPAHLELQKVEIHAGRSTQATLNGRQSHTIESLYLSPALRARIRWSAMATVDA